MRHLIIFYFAMIAMLSFALSAGVSTAQYRAGQQSPVTGETLHDYPLTAERQWDAQRPHWRDHFDQRPYDKNTYSYEDYEPAYRFGYDLSHEYSNVDYNLLDESTLQQRWEDHAESHTLPWRDVRGAIRDAYNYQIRYARTIDETP